VPVLYFHQGRIDLEFMIVDPVKPFFPHGVVQTDQGVIRMGDSGQDRVAVTIVEIGEADPPQEQPEAAAVITLPHGFHGLQNAVGGKRFFCCF